MPDKEFIVYFNDDNQLTIRKILVDIRDIHLLDFETSSSKNEVGGERVKRLPEIRWTEEEV